MKRILFAVTLLCALAVAVSSCGSSDKIASLSINATGETGTINLEGLGATMQLQVLANYTSGKQIDETNYVTYNVTPQGYDEDTGSSLQAPPMTLTVSPTGLVTSVDPPVCTWVSTTGDISTPGWAITGSYIITATYRGFTSQPIYIPISSAASNQQGMEGECGPTTTAAAKRRESK